MRIVCVLKFLKLNFVKLQYYTFLHFYLTFINSIYSKHFNKKVLEIK